MGYGVQGYGLISQGDIAGSSRKRVRSKGGTLQAEKGRVQVAQEMVAGSKKGSTCQGDAKA